MTKAERKAAYAEKQRTRSPIVPEGFGTVKTKKRRERRKRALARKAKGGITHAD